MSRRHSADQSTGSADGDVAVHVDGLWKIFGPKADKIMNSADAQLSRKELQEKTGHVVGIRDVSFDVAPGEVFVVMGLSGSGKSTLVRLLTRLIEPTAGTVQLYGEDITAMNDRALLDTRRRRVSMVFQHFGLLPHRKVIDNIAFGLEVRGEGKADRRNRAQEMVDLVGLSGYENNFPDQLSGGMQQRVGLARALAADPDIMMFDEPFSALDPLIRRDMQNEVIRLHHEVGKTMVFITHDLAEALKLGDRILIMRDGEIVQIGYARRGGRRAGRRLRPRLRQRRTALARAHAQVGDARPDAAEAADVPIDGPVLQSDQIVRDAARVVLDHHGPCRVVDGDKLVGVVDDEDILRVVVAEEDAVMTDDRASRTRPRNASPRSSSRTSRRASRGTPASSCSASWSSGWSPTSRSQGQCTKALGLQDTTALQRKFNEARDWVQLEGQDNWFFGGVLGAIGDS